jgi:hypothetical protein
LGVDTATLVGGLAFILIALVGGGFVVKDVHVPELPGWSRLVAGLLGALLVVPSLANSFRDPMGSGEGGSPTPSPADPERTATPSGNGVASPTAGVPHGSCNSLATNAQVKAGPQHGSASATLVAASYTLTPGKQMHIQLAGQVDSGPEPDTQFYLLLTADPNSSDSLHPPNPGTTYFAMSDGKITPNMAGCWTTIQSRLGYPCSGGITARYFLGLVPTSQAANLRTLWQSSNQQGVPIEEFTSRGALLLDSFDVPTPKVPPPCP